MRLNAYLVKGTVVAALGGLLFGFDTVMISTVAHAQPHAARYIPNTFTMSATAFSCSKAPLASLSSPRRKSA